MKESPEKVDRQIARKPHHFVVGGVPEHFNLPWHLAREEGAFSCAGIELEWQDFPGGTGAMTKALRDGTVDIAIVLTEGIVADIARGNPSQILQVYVETPLIWGVHVAADSKFEQPNDLRGGKYAISRYGSGSHLISFVDAQQRGWDPAAQQFELVGNLEGALKALTGGTADCLLWEKFTTKPYVDSGTLRRIGEVHTPWPCFVVAVRKDRLEHDAEQVAKISEVINARVLAFMNSDQAEAMVAARYGLQTEDVKEWLSGTRWASNKEVAREMLEHTAETLFKLDIIEAKPAPEEMVCAQTELS